MVQRLKKDKTSRDLEERADEERRGLLQGAFTSLSDDS